MRKLLILAAFVIGGGVSAPAMAYEALPQPLARQLDGLAAEFTMSAAKERRLYMMQELTRQQQQQGRGQPGPNRGYAPGPRPGYGPGYAPPPGYGPRPGYGPPRGYGPRRDYGPPRGYRNDYDYRYQRY